MKKKIFLLLAVIILAAAGYTGWKFFGPATAAPEGKFFYIKTGESFEAMKQNLIAQKIIKPSAWFGRAAKLLKFKTVKAGKYEIKKDLSLFQLIRMLRAGRQATVNLTITKLRTREDLAMRMEKVFEFDSLQAIKFFGNADTLKQYGLDSNTVMSVVLPDTYTYFWNSTPKKVFQKLFDESQKFWNESRKEKASKLALTPLQVVTLASIIDEETNYAPEKPDIASVYINRLRKNMPLQADPTLKFALRNFAARRVLFSFIEAESPYNTYRNTGLPPGPICTPQRETIDAVLNAPGTNYLYFVAKSDFSGSHVFTTNYDDHLKYAREFHKAMDEQASIRKALEANRQDSLRKANSK
jgi:UPF0755 protein